MFNNDSLEKLWSYSTVPDAFRINDNDRPSAAYAKAWSFAALYARWTEQEIFAFEKGCKLRVKHATTPVGRAKPSGADDDVARVRLHPGSRVIDRLGSHLIVLNRVGSFVVARGRYIQIVSHNVAVDQMLGDYSLGTDSIDGRVPYVVRIHDNHRTVSALIHAACVIDSDDIANTCGGHGFLESGMNLN